MSTQIRKIEKAFCQSLELACAWTILFSAGKSSQMAALQGVHAAFHMEMKLHVVYACAGVVSVVWVQCGSHITL